MNTHILIIHLVDSVPILDSRDLESRHSVVTFHILAWIDILRVISEFRRSPLNLRLRPHLKNLARVRKSSELKKFKIKKSIKIFPKSRKKIFVKKNFKEKCHLNTRLKREKIIGVNRILETYPDSSQIGTVFLF